MAAYSDVKKSLSEPVAELSRSPSVASSPQEILLLDSQVREART